MAGVRLPVLVGPTGVGKTSVACALLTHWSLEVISADSRQVYRRQNIGTAKTSRKWLARVPHHGIDLIDPGRRYSAGHFAREAPRWIDQVRSRGNLPVIVGGTGLYIRALTDGLFAEPPLDRDRRRAMGDCAETLDPRELLR